MTLEVELFRSDDYVRYDEIELLPLLKGFFETLLDQPLNGARFRLVFLPVADPVPLRGTPSLVNLRASHGYVQVYIVRDGELLYRHPHPVREIVGRQLRDYLSEREPAETHWGFGIRGQAMDRVALVRPAPEVTHSVRIPVRAKRPSLFQLEAVEEPEPPKSTLAELGADVTEDDPGAVADVPVYVVIDEAVREAFVRTTPFSDEVEEGGFLAGRVFRHANRPGGFIVEVTAAIQAERTGASMLNFTFTGESFLRIGEQISTRGQDERLLGWYHTHLFPATDSLGLSSVDVDLHRSTFRQPWQVAALVNITENARRLRFYSAQGETMARAPYWTVRR